MCRNKHKNVFFISWITLALHVFFEILYSLAHIQQRNIGDIFKKCDHRWIDSNNWMREQDHCIRRHNRVKSILLCYEDLPTEGYHNDPNIMLLALICFLEIRWQHGSIEIGCLTTVVKFWKAVLFNFRSSYFFLQLLEEILAWLLLTSEIIIVMILLLEGVFLKSISAVFCVFMTFIRFFSFLSCISSICAVLLSVNLRIVVILITRRWRLILKIQYEEVFTGVCIIAFTAFLYLVIAIRVVSTSILGILKVFMILIVCILYERLVLLIECVLHLAVF